MLRTIIEGCQPREGCSRNFNPSCFLHWVAVEESCRMTASRRANRQHLHRRRPILRDGTALDDAIKSCCWRPFFFFAPSSRDNSTPAKYRLPRLMQRRRRRAAVHRAVRAERFVRAHKQNFARRLPRAERGKHAGRVRLLVLVRRRTRR